MLDSGTCDWLVLALPLSTTQFSLDHKRRSRKRNQKKWKRSDSSDSVELDSSCYSDLRFLPSHKLSYDSDPVTSENRPLGVGAIVSVVCPLKAKGFKAIKRELSGNVTRLQQSELTF